MKGRARTSLIVGMSLVCGVGAFVATVWAHGAFGPEKDAHPLGWLGLSEEQHQAIHTTDPTFDKEAIQLADELRQRRHGLAELLEAEDAADARILDQVELVIAAHNSLERRVAKHVLAIRKHLTPAQQKRLMGLCARQVRGNGGPESPGNDSVSGDVHMQPLGTDPGSAAVIPGGSDERRAEHRAVAHRLLEQHKSIRRTVKQIPGGVETVTTSDEPEVADLIRSHVNQMKRRMDNGELIHAFDPLFEEIFKRHEDITFSIELIDRGVRVRETSDDPQVVKLIRQHATRAVSEFVKRGPPRASAPTPLPKGYDADAD